VFTLNRRHRLNCMSATNRFRSCFGKAKVLHLTLLDQLLHGSGDVFDRHVRINAMLVEEIDGIDFEPLEGCFRDLLDVLRPAIQAWRSLHPPRIEFGIKVKPEFRCYRHLSTKGSKGFPYKFFVCKWTVHLSGVEERDPAFDRLADESTHLLLACRRPVGKTHTHTAEPESGDFHVALSKLALLHFSSYVQSPAAACSKYTCQGSAILAPCLGSQLS